LYNKFVNIFVQQKRLKLLEDLFYFMSLASKLEKAAKPVIDELKKLKETRAICFYGSLGGETVDKHSDVDLLCFCKKFPPRKVRDAFLKKMGTKRYSLRGKFDAFVLNGVEFAILYVPVDVAEKTLKMFLKEKHGGFEGSIETTLIKMKIVYDPKGVVRKWKGKVKKYPRWLKRRNFNSLSAARRMLETIPTSIERNNKIFIDFSVVWCLEKLINAIYALNDAYYSTPKWFQSDLKKFKLKPKNCKKRFDKINELNNNKEILKKVKLIDKLISDTELLANKQMKGLKMRRRPVSTEEVIKQIKRVK